MMVMVARKNDDGCTKTFFSALRADGKRLYLYLYTFAISYIKFSEHFGKKSSSYTVPAGHTAGYSLAREGCGTCSLRTAVNRNVEICPCSRANEQQSERAFVFQRDKEQQHSI